MTLQHLAWAVGSLLIIGCQSQTAVTETPKTESLPTTPAPAKPENLARIVANTGNPDVDSIINDYQIQYPIRLLQKTYIDGVGQFTFIINATKTEFHERLLTSYFDEDETKNDTYKVIYEDLLEEDSLARVKAPREIAEGWLPVFWHEGLPHILRTCDFYRYYEISDSRFLEYDQDGIYPTFIHNVKKEGSDYTVETTRKTLHFILKDAERSIYLLREEDTYVIPRSKAMELHIIIEDCSALGADMIGFDHTPPNDN